ncbi:SWIM zinc finger family protein [Nocardia crassostreae]|uniref:SWIM zinc finger family protein n=1 Tax=Nocardia crassostreae TaxID=53428 RepID=UPI0008356D4F|nr:SWIM zinc finger family protein [Nocardia crassostreae]
MTTAWTADQIAAIAPDGASLTAARKLGGKWTTSGRHETTLWGLCKGSGSKPYQTIVDISGPAYKCSCPSRKFPCKHALSLLLCWSEGAVPAADAPADFAAEWLAGRAAREAKKAAPEAKSRPANSATADQRQARVTVGLADLDTWLTDQVRTGLAQADRSHHAFETVAARMVDAQAPGVALTLRRLPRLATRSDWPGQLLREYARLHLLATAHRRLADLSPALQSSIRTHIGYPVPAESVRAEPAVRDHWMVLGLHSSVEDNLHTRRVWLRGRTTARWALLIDHSHGSPSFPPDTPPLGFQVDAYLHFYPNAAPLRALWGARHATPEPVTTSTPHRSATATADPVAAGGTAPTTVLGAGNEGSAADDGVSDLRSGAAGEARSGSIAAALAEHARALGADPFLRGWPVLLTDIVPVRGEKGWYVVESEGASLPVAIGDGEPWRLLGFSGGHPVTLIGEWTVDGLVPVAALAAGAVVDVLVGDGSSRGMPSGIPIEFDGGAGGAELVSTALVGTARRSGEQTGLAAPVAAVAGRLTREPAAALLESVALQDCFARGGFIAGSADRDGVADADPRPLLPQAAAARLAALLSDNSPFLEEWFAVAAERDFRAPDALSRILLDRAKSLAPHREPLLRLAGARGRWLAGQHPGWRTLVRAAAEDEGVWAHGRAAERRAWLAQLRQRDPGAARAALSSSWGTESGPGKMELLAVLADGLSLEDERLLEEALDDRRAKVRRLAADLLGRLPDSAFAGRMAARAGAWLSFGQRLRQPQLTTTGPGVLDDAARRDGVGDAFGYTAYRADGAPDLAAEWLHRVVAATPLSHWERVLGPPQQAVRAPMAEGVRGPMFSGWADAALAQRDSQWDGALFGTFGTPEAGEVDSEKLRELFALQPEAEQVRHLRRLDSSWLAEIESLLRAMPHPWPGAMAEHVLRLLLERAQLSADRPGAPSLVPGSYRTLFRAASAHFPVDVAAMVTGIARKCGDPYWEQAFDQLAHDLIQRKTMLEELT